MRVLFHVLFFSGLFLVLTQCTKKDCNCTQPAAGEKLSYGDSVFYLRSAAYTISPREKRVGTYSAFPGNLQIDPTTGKITVDVKGNDGNSQTGLWYKINFRAATGETDSTMLLLSGLSYIDKFYQLNQHDSIIYPIYNGDPANAVPSGNYDLKHYDEFAINPANGQINIRECIRRGYFSKQLNTTWKQASIRYAINDRSNAAVNQIDILVYYYNTMNDVPSNVSRLMQAHQSMTLGFRTGIIPDTDGPIDNNLPGDLSTTRALSKPRPPCIVIIGH